MTEPPRTRYALVGDAQVAYQIVGQGPFDLLYFWGLGSHVELFWDDPTIRAFLGQLASFSRLIVFDRRGTGASDSIDRGAIPTWEQCTEDIRAVLDAAGSEQAAVFAEVDAGPTAMLFAAMQPERVRSLVLANTFARYAAADDYSFGAASEAGDAVIEAIGSLWGTPELFEITSGSATSDREWLPAATKMNRAAMTPRSAAMLYRHVLGVDVRTALPLIQAPTLILHNNANPLIPAAHGRYLAEHITGARFVELVGDGVSWNRRNFGSLIDEVTQFLTGQRPVVEVNRILTTILFTDIVGSTERVVSMGDKRWRAVLDSHDRLVRDHLRYFRGREVNTTGDGFVASFDGPARAIRCARAITEACEAIGIFVRAGLHTGECEVRGDDLAGLALHVASRVGAVAGPGEVLVSGIVKELTAGSGIDFTERGSVELKGLPGLWPLFTVTKFSDVLST